jgi:periplasmic divalent cation tolerance protein
VSVVLTTIAAREDAIALARSLIEERLAACVNILPQMTSVYRWKGAVEEEAEHQIVIKTASDRIPALEVRLKQLHPYELPELLVLSVAGGAQPYLTWVIESTS